MISPQDRKVLYNIKQFCEATALGRSTVFDLIRSGRLKAVHPTPRSTRITANELARFVRALEADAGEQ
jgi:excisionase family DNA binding protein